MVSPDLLQAAVVNRLLNYTPLTTVVGVEVREVSWQGTQFVYPNVRVGQILQVPRGDGNCRPVHSTISWTVSAFSDDPSSILALQIAGHIAKALFDYQLVGSGFRTLRVDSRGTLGPFRSRPRVWQADAYFIADIYE